MIKTTFRQLGLPVFEPLRINKLEIVQPDGPVTLKLYMKNVDLHGLSNAKITRVSGFEKNFEKAKIEVVVSFPQMRLQGLYKIDGRVQVLPVQGQGNANMTFSKSADNFFIIVFALNTQYMFLNH